MEHIKLFKFSEDSSEYIGIQFKFSNNLKQKIKSLAAIRWSKVEQCYCLPLSKFKLEEVFRYFNEKAVYVDYSQVQQRTEQSSPKRKTQSKRTKKGRTLSDIQKQLISEYINYLKGMRLSESTVRTYFTFVADFISYCHKIPTTSLSNEHVRLFVEKQVQSKNYSVSTHRQLISAIKHLGRFLSNSLIEIEDLPRPYKSSYLPTILSKNEIIDLLRFTKNLKHRTILALIYSCGLRVGEVITLKLYDVDIDRQQLTIKQSKNRKDRVIVLAKSFIPLFKNYFTAYQPTKYFIENPKGGIYSAGSIRSFLKKSCQQAHINKKVTPHTLRHSYATHLIENGVGLRYVQELLGHSKPETTMIYTHVAKKDILNIESPLDTTLKSLSQTDKVESKLTLSNNIGG